MATQIPLSQAKAQLTELVRRAEAGDDIILTRHGRPSVRLVPVRGAANPEARRTLLQALQRAAVAKAKPGPSAERSQDHLYDQLGLPK